MHLLRWLGRALGFLSLNPSPIQSGLDPDRARAGTAHELQLQISGPDANFNYWIQNICIGRAIRLFLQSRLILNPGIKFVPTVSFNDTSQNMPVHEKFKI